MQLLADRKLLVSGVISCTTEQFAQVFQDTITKLLEADMNGCEDGCDCDATQADGHNEGSYCEHGDVGAEQTKQSPPPRIG